MCVMLGPLITQVGGRGLAAVGGHGVGGAAAVSNNIKQGGEMCPPSSLPLSPMIQPPTPPDWVWGNTSFNPDRLEQDVTALSTLREKDLEIPKGINGKFQKTLGCKVPALGGAVRGEWFCKTYLLP